MIKNICVFGSYKPIEQDGIKVILIGKKLAEQGYAIISGGFGGSMEQISKGAKQAGGKTIGVTYYEFLDLKYDKANEYVDEEIITRSIHERISKMMELADAFLAFPGGTGTLFELASVLESVNKGLIQNKPIICFGDYWKPSFDNLKTVKITNKDIKKRYGKEHVNEMIIYVHSIDSLLQILKKFK